MLQVITGVVFQHLVHGGNHGAVSHHCFKAQHERARHTKTQNLVASGIGRNIAADIAGPPGSKVQRKDEACIIGSFLNNLQGGASLNRHGH